MVRWGIVGDRDLGAVCAIKNGLAKQRLVLVLVCGLLCIVAGFGAEQSHAVETKVETKVEPTKPRYQIREIQNTLEEAFTHNVSLIDANGDSVQLSDLVAEPKQQPVIMQFIFTSCANVCPVMSTILRAVQKDLVGKAQLISISIDPEFDDADKLQDYAKTFDAQPHWRFFTGELDDIIRLQKQIDIYQQNKMRHQPVTFFLLNQRLFRLDGLPSKEDTLAELDKMLEETQLNSTKRIESRLKR
ncbi:MAG: cytochrome oxidase Cu insertion factor (SCO1/SenC/PrrC family) [Arenicella sp.]|jgi:cytochrome oxidase Cu insertion factor (SCO1/SenC/PrrC family)